MRREDRDDSERPRVSISTMITGSEGIEASSVPRKKEREREREIPSRLSSIYVEKRNVISRSNCKPLVRREMNATIRVRIILR